MANKKKIKAPAIAKPISAKELKFWLEGFLDFQEDNWIPNAEQWNKIKDKIFNLKDEEATVVYAQASSSLREPNVFVPNNGGAAGLSAHTFPPGSLEESALVAAAALQQPSFHQPSIPIDPALVAAFGPAGGSTAAVKLPIRDANGFLTMPEDFGASESPVLPSGKTVKYNPDGYS